jgi:hypothetical protein
VAVVVRVGRMSVGVAAAVVVVVSVGVRPVPLGMLVGMVVIRHRVTATAAIMAVAMDTPVATTMADTIHRTDKDRSERFEDVC